MTDIKTNEKRRKVLKTAGVATVAAGAWHKPVLNSVVTPAHAQTSVPAVMISGAGASSSTPPIAMHNKNTNDSLVDNAIDALLPSAHAGGEPGEVVRACEALTDPFSSEDSDNTHCVSLMFPNGTDRNGEVMVSVMGPTLYYRRQCFYYADPDNFQGATQSYAGSLTAGGSDTVTMNDGNFMVTLNNVNVFGSIDADFDNATGTLIYTGPDEEIEIGGNGYACSPNGGEGAYWAAELGESGGSCTPGLGAEGGSRLIAINSDVCELQD